MDNNITNKENLQIFEGKDSTNDECLFLEDDGENYYLHENIQDINRELEIDLNNIPEKCKSLSFSNLCKIQEKTFKFTTPGRDITLFLEYAGSKNFVIEKNAFGEDNITNIFTKIEGKSDDVVLLLKYDEFKYIKEICREDKSLIKVNIRLNGKWNKTQITELLNSTENDCKLYKTKSFIYESDEKIDEQYNPKLSEGLLNSIKDTIEEKNEEKNIKERKAKKSKNTEPGIDSIEEDDSSNKYFRFDELGNYNTDLKKEIFKELINKFQDNDMKINIKPTTIIFSENKIEYKDTYSVSFNGDLVNALKELCECKFYINSEEKSPENNKSNRDNIKESFREYLQSNQNHLSEINSDLINYYPDGSIKPLDLIKLIKESNIIDENKTNSQNKKNLESLFNEYKFLTRSKDAKIKQWIYKELCTNKGKLRLAGRGLKNDYNEMLKIRSETPADDTSICNPLKGLIEQAENLMKELKEARKEVN